MKKIIGIIPKYSSQYPVIRQRGGIFTNRVTTLCKQGVETNVYEPGAVVRVINKMLGRENVISVHRHPYLLKPLVTKLKNIISSTKSFTNNPYSMHNVQKGLGDAPTKYYEYHGSF